MLCFPPHTRERERIRQFSLSSWRCAILLRLLRANTPEMDVYTYWNIQCRSLSIGTQSSYSTRNHATAVTTVIQASPSMFSTVVPVLFSRPLVCNWSATIAQIDSHRRTIHGLASRGAGVGCSRVDGRWKQRKREGGRGRTRHGYRSRNSSSHVRRLSSGEGGSGRGDKREDGVFGAGTVPSSEAAAAVPLVSVSSCIWARSEVVESVADRSTCLLSLLSRSLSRVVFALERAGGSPDCAR